MESRRDYAQDDTDEKVPSNAKAGSRAKRSFMYYVYILTNKTDTVMYPPQKKKGLTYDIPI